MMPLYLLISLGMFFRARAFLSQTFWDDTEKLIYYVLIPALIFSSLSRAQFNLDLLQSVVLLLALPTMLIGVIQGLALLTGWVSRATMTSMFQGAVRNNTTIALVIVAIILPRNGVGLLALVMTVMIIINNLSSVWVLTRFGDSDKSPSWQSMVKSIFQNPMIQASIAGVVVNLLPFKLVPDALMETIGYLGATGLPLALLVIGAGLKLKSLAGKTFAIVFSSVFKLIVTPVVVYFLCRYFALQADLSAVFLLLASMPTAMSSYVLASQMGGDKETMAQIITFQMIVAAITLPIVLNVIQKIVLS